MNQEECTVVEFFARRQRTSFDSLATSEGYLVVLGGDAKCFDRFSDAMGFLSPSLLVEGRPPRNARPVAQVATTKGFG